MAASQKEKKQRWPINGMASDGCESSIIRKTKKKLREVYNVQSRKPKDIKMKKKFQRT